jgi:hypothetical protein
MACCRVSGTPGVWAGEKDAMDSNSMRKARRITVIGDIRNGEGPQTGGAE